MKLILHKLAACLLLIYTMGVVIVAFHKETLRQLLKGVRGIWSIN